jgi:hypothetical protein
MPLTAEYYGLPCAIGVRKMLKSLLFTGLLLTVTPVLAQTQPQSAAPQVPQQSKDDPNKVICQTQKEIGSRLASKRICMTAAQWKEHQQQVHDQLDQLHMSVQPTGGPG